jgi:hypothetical protein
VIADLIGKGKHIRTVPVPAWAKRVVDEWTDAASISTGALFRRVGRLGKIWGANLTPKAIWHIVKAAAKRAEIKNLALMTYAAPAPDSVTWPGENSNRFSFYLAMRPFRRPSITWDANKNCDTL